MALTKTTKLQAINAMLSTIGEPPVNTLTSQRADSLVAQNILDEVCREVQSYGWMFNTSENVEMVPETSTGYIYVSDSVVRVDKDPSFYNYDVVIRGNRLYNRKTNSYVFGETIKTTQVYLMDFEEMPEIAKRYITVRSARIFQDRMVGSEKIHGFTVQDEVQALARMTEYENEVGDYTIFDSPDVWRTFIREGSYRVS
jgi:hypothetical protein